MSDKIFLHWVWPGRTVRLFQHLPRSMKSRRYTSKYRHWRNANYMVMSNAWRRRWSTRDIGEPLLRGPTSVQQRIESSNYNGGQFVRYTTTIINGLCVQNDCFDHGTCSYRYYASLRAFISHEWPNWSRNARHRCTLGISGVCGTKAEKRGEGNGSKQRSN